MKISERFNLGKSQFELDFVDVDEQTDTPLFLDPYYISKSEYPFAEKCNETIKSFFEYLLMLLRENRIDEAKEIFLYLGEPNEVCLGLSKGKPRGKGIGPSDTKSIFKSLIESKAVKSGVMEDIEDFRIFVKGIDKDKISDMVINIVRKHLLDYTEEQCNLWDINMQENVLSGYYWDSASCSWQQEYRKILVIEGEEKILVPKRLVSFSQEYTSQKYKQHFVLNFMQNEHLRLQTHLVKERVKDKTKYVTKKSIEEEIKKEEEIDKDWLADFTKKHYEIFKNFKSNTINNIKVIKNEELTNQDVNGIIEYLETTLINIDTGPDKASEYHNIIMGILELIFYPYLCNPVKEYEINEGRKRIDIKYTNCAEKGIFFRIPNQFQIPCPYIFVECKNYSRDVKNPELDQMIGRFSVNRGKVGIITCRNIENIDLFLARCKDTYRDQQGLIIPLVDEDIIKMMNALKSGKDMIWQEVIEKRINYITSI